MMPTYRNSSKLNIHVKEVGLMVEAGESVSTVLVVPDSLMVKYAARGLTLENDLPAYNPVIEEHLLTFNDTSEVEVELTMLGVDYIEISHSDIDAVVWLQSKENVPPLWVSAGEFVSVKINNNLNRLFIEPTGTGQMHIREMADNITIRRG